MSKQQQLHLAAAERLELRLLTAKNSNEKKLIILFVNKQLVLAGV